MGHDVCTANVILGSALVEHATQREKDAAGAAVTRTFASLLNETSAVPISSLRTGRALELVKEACCYVRQRGERHGGGFYGGGGGSSKVVLPDGQEVLLEAGEAHLAFEPIFGEAGRVPAGAAADSVSERRSVQAMVVAAMDALPEDADGIETRRRLVGGLVLGGGTCAARGFRGRFREELVAALPPSVSDGTMTIQQGNSESAWRGGCVMADMQAGSGAGWVARADWEEHGPKAWLTKAWHDS